jgi:hypothetical protein
MMRGFHVPSRTVRIALGAVAGAALAVSAVGSVSAHEHRTVAGYSVLVGWRDEPTFTGVRNAIQVFINDGKGKAVDDLGDTLKVWLIYKDNTSAPQTPMPAFDPDTGMGTEGEYDVAIIPMKAGTYTVHLKGTIRGAVVDEKFTSSDTTFANVDDRNSVQFPGGLEKAPKPDAPMKMGGAVGIVAVPLALLLGGARYARRYRRRQR